MRQFVLKTAYCWLSLGVAAGLTLPATGCAGNDTDDPAPSTDQIEQGLTTCDYEYFDADGHEIGFCFVPCGGPAQCTGTTRGPLVVHIEFSCETCRRR
jgi:hypothetical protein